MDRKGTGTQSPTNSVSVKLTARQYEWLKQKSEDDDRSLSQIIRRLVGEKMKSEEGENENLNHTP